MKKMHGISTKAFAALLAVTLLVGSAIGGTLAWLTSSSGELVNTFTIGNVEIELTETKGVLEGKDRTFKVIPGVDIEKDPKVTVKANSEACWVFVKIDEQNWNTALSYSLAEEWKELENGVYYRLVDANTNDQVFEVLKDNQIIVNKELTKEMMENSPKLIFKAYAIQQEGFNDSEKSDSENAAAAWKAIEEQSK